MTRTFGNKMKFSILASMLILVVSCNSERSTHKELTQDLAANALKVSHDIQNMIEFTFPQGPDAMSFSVWDEHKNVLWHVNMGHRPLTKIQYGIVPLPKIKDHRMYPKQAIPAASKPKNLKPGDKIIILYEYPKDLLPMTPSSASRAWSLKIPEVGEGSIGTKLDL